LRYNRDILDYGVLIPNQRNTDKKATIYGCSDSDWEGHRDDKTSTICHLFMIGAAPISWSSKKQGIVALSPSEAKYVATSYAACQALWIEMLLEELNAFEVDRIKFLVDNKSAIDLANHPISHGKS